MSNAEIETDKVGGKITPDLAGAENWVHMVFLGTHWCSL